MIDESRGARPTKVRPYRPALRWRVGRVQIKVSVATSKPLPRGPQKQGASCPRGLGLTNITWPKRIGIFAACWACWVALATSALEAAGYEVVSPPAAPSQLLGAEEPTAANLTSR